MNNKNNILILVASRDESIKLIKSLYNSSKDLQPVLLNEQEILLYDNHKFKTKYYEAFVDSYLYEFTKDIKCIVDHLQHFQAIISVYQTEEEFKHVQNVHTKLTDLNIVFETRLCVAYYFKGNEKHKEIVSKWCVDEGYDHIEILKDQPTMENEREKFGTARIIEVLECTMWPDMKRINQPKQTFNIPKMEEKSNQDEYFAKLAEEMKSQKSTEDVKKDVKEEDVKEKVVKKEVKEDEIDEEEEKKLEEFDQLFTAMLDLKKNGHLLSDKERKDKAANLALALLHMLEQEDKEGEL